ncbi:hypothetical protein LTR86_008847 [Recurvomyces mirabilis]|nr:hypothetical protein LTR86_008847 [Recurvomyces mirabilis]
MEDDNFFSDDEFDTIPDNTLRELEQNAISSTQRQQPDGGVSKWPAVTSNNLAGRAQPGRRQWQPPRPQTNPSAPPQTAPPASAPAPPSSDYGFEEEDVIDLDEPSMAIQPGPSSQSWTNISLRPDPAANGRRASKAPLDAETEAAFAAADAELGGHIPDEWAHAPHLQPTPGDGVDVATLQARVAQLEAEQLRLRQAEQEARNATITKQGEIAIVRANQDKASKEYERRIAVMQKLHAEEAAKTRAELDAGRKEREKMETDNRFLQHDLAQEAARVKRVDSGKGKGAIPIRERITPRKNKRSGLGDGFDDDEVRTASPSRSREKAKDVTPKHGMKRKRTTDDSPVAPLSFSEPAAITRLDSQEQPAALAEQFGPAQHLHDDRLEFMQRLLNHRSEEGHERTIEALAKYSLSSNPKDSLSAILIGQLAYAGTIDRAEYLPIRVARASLDVWSRCLSEKVYEPIFLLLDIVRFSVYLEPATIISQLVEDALPVLMRTIEVIANPTLRASKNPVFAASLDAVAQEKLSYDLCADEVMELLLQICQASSLCGDRLEAFWRTMDFEFTLLMMSKAQPIVQISSALNMLATSAQPTSFGPINADMQKQPGQEAGIIDRLTTLLMEKPDVPKDEPQYTEIEIAGLRLDILHVLRALCLTDNGGLLLTQHPYLMGRLVRFLDGQIYKLYGLTPPLPSTANEDAEAPITAHGLVAKTINTTTLIFYHLLRTYEDSLDLTKKLNMIRGGWPKLLVSMSRIAFSEQLVLEYGIEDSVTEAAHAILDSVLSPEEGEAIVAAVETPRGSKGSLWGVGGELVPTERDTSREETQVEGEDSVMSNEPG